MIWEDMGEPHILLFLFCHWHIHSNTDAGATTSDMKQHLAQGHFNMLLVFKDRTIDPTIRGWHFPQLHSNLGLGYSWQMPRWLEVESFSLKVLYLLMKSTWFFLHTQQQKGKTDGLLLLSSALTSVISLTRFQSCLTLLSFFVAQPILLLT